MCNNLINNRLSLWIWFFYNIILWMGSKAFGVDFLLFLRRGKAFFMLLCDLCLFGRTIFTACIGYPPRVGCSPSVPRWSSLPACMR